MLKHPAVYSDTDPLVFATRTNYYTIKFFNTSQVEEVVERVPLVYFGSHTLSNLNDFK